MLTLIGMSVQVDADAADTEPYKTRSWWVVTSFRPDGPERHGHGAGVPVRSGDPGGGPLRRVLDAAHAFGGQDLLVGPAKRLLVQERNFRDGNPDACPYPCFPEPGGLGRSRWPRP